MKHWIVWLPMLAASCSFSDAPNIIDKTAFIGCYADGVNIINITPSDVHIGRDRFKYAIDSRTIGPVLNVDVIFKTDDYGRLMPFPSDEHLYRFQGSDEDLTLVIADTNAVVHQLRRASCSD